MNTTNRYNKLFQNVVVGNKMVCLYKAVSAVTKTRKIIVTAKKKSYNNTNIIILLTQPVNT